MYQRVSFAIIQKDIHHLPKGQADAIAISAVGSIIGNGVVTNAMSEKMGYIKSRKRLMYYRWMQRHN